LGRAVPKNSIQTINQPDFLLFSEADGNFGSSEGQESTIFCRTEPKNPFFSG